MPALPRRIVDTWGRTRDIYRLSFLRLIRFPKRAHPPPRLTPHTPRPFSIAGVDLPPGSAVGPPDVLLGLTDYELHTRPIPEASPPPHTPHTPPSLSRFSFSPVSRLTPLVRFLSQESIYPRDPRSDLPTSSLD